MTERVEKEQRARISWMAGTRSEILRLGPLFGHFFEPGRGSGPLHRFCFTAEQGTAAYQALDYVGVRPHEEFALRHPAEDAAIRLNGVLGEVEKYLRQTRATHAVFAGWGPTAAASAIVCHARKLRGLWLRPYDPAGLVADQQWERGLDAIVRSLGESVKTIEVGPPGKGEAAGEDGVAEVPEPVIAGRRPGAPIALVNTGKLAWAYGRTPEQIVEAARGWATAYPDIDWIFLRSLGAHFEGVYRSMADRPANLLGTPPVPYPEYRALLAGTVFGVSDSPNQIAEFSDAGIPCIAMGEREGEDPSQRQIEMVTFAQPGALGDEVLQNRIREILGNILRPSAKRTDLWQLDDSLLQIIRAQFDSLESS